MRSQGFAVRPDRVTGFPDEPLSLQQEIGYEVTMVKDATADYGDEEMHAALDVNIPAYATAIVTTTEILASLSSL